MRILVCPAVMELGGSQLNAVELAAETARRGHEVALYAPSGALDARVRQLGLEHIRPPVEGRWPSRRSIGRLVDLVRERRFDVVHGYEWGPAVDLAFGPHLRLGTPLVVTVLSMDVPGFLPRHVPLLVGTNELVESSLPRYPRVELMEPPIDTRLNAPTDRGAARRGFGVAEDELLLSVVCRLTSDLDKSAGVLEAIAVVEELAGRYPVRLLVAGEGAELAAVESAADGVNHRTGRRTVLVTGGLLDPRPAYDAADVVLGMGSSALKGMAFDKPLVVQGAAGFWRLLTPETAPEFLSHGWYGHGNGNGAQRLHAALAPVLGDAAERTTLGAFGRRLVEERFSLTAAGTRLEALYHRTAAERWSAGARMRHLVCPAVELATFKTVLAHPSLRDVSPRRALRRAQAVTT